MKTFILILVFLISFSALASNWIPVSKITQGSKIAYQLESECQKTGEQCLDVGDSPDHVSLGFITTEDKFLKSQEEACLDEVDCESKFQALTCENFEQTKIKNLNLLEVYCVQPDGKKLVIDSAAIASYQAQQIAQAEQSVALAYAKKLRECGEGVMDLLLVRNSTKNLTKGQIKQMVSSFASIKGLLETGSLNSAKEEIEAVTPDGTLVTAEDKNALISAINACLGG